MIIPPNIFCIISLNANPTTTDNAPISANKDVKLIYNIIKIK